MLHKYGNSVVKVIYWNSNDHCCVISICSNQPIEVLMLVTSSISPNSYNQYTVSKYKLLYQCTYSKNIVNLDVLKLTAVVITRWSCRSERVTYWESMERWTKMASSTAKRTEFTVLFHQTSCRTYQRRTAATTATPPFQEHPNQIDNRLQETTYKRAWIMIAPGHHKKRIHHHNGLSNRNVLKLPT